MKKTFVVTMLVVMVAISGSLFAKAKACGGGCDDPEAASAGMHEKRHGGKMAMLTRVLELSEEQQAQVREIMAEEHALVGPQVKQMRETRKEIRSLVTSGQFDEEKVRGLAEQQSAVKTELVVAKARAHNRIWALLNADQRELAEKLQPLFEKHGPRHGH